MKTLVCSISLPFFVFLGACRHHDTALHLPPPIADPPPAPPVDSERSKPVVNPVELPTRGSSEAELAPTNEAPRTSVSQLLLCLADAYFDYDQDLLRPDAQVALRADSSIVKRILDQQPDTTLVVEGHADERGSAEYNLALGARRADMAKEFLVNLGVPDKALKTVSYGKERPQCTDETEECWQKNRRAHMATGE
ncbi:MAG TPA: OmpA family protein [Bryobacteraceae bacterium]|nr:OmpA family protein [Bryobacteraceae bacterium]